MKKEQLLTGSMIFALLSLVDPKYKGAKRGRKAVSREIKKKMRAAAAEDRKRCEKIVHDGRFILDIARDRLVEEIGDDGKYIDPGTLIKLIMKRYPEYLEPFDLKADHVDEISNHFGQGGLTMNSIKYANRLIEEINKEIAK